MVLRRGVERGTLHAAVIEGKGWVSVLVEWDPAELCYPHSGHSLGKLGHVQAAAGRMQAAPLGKHFLPKRPPHGNGSPRAVMLTPAALCSSLNPSPHSALGTFS